MEQSWHWSTLQSKNTRVLEIHSETTMSEEERKEICIHTAKLSRFTSLFDCIPVCYSPARIVYQNCSLLHLAQTLLVEEAPACENTGKAFGLQISRMLQNWSLDGNKI